MATDLALDGQISAAFQGRYVAARTLRTTARSATWLAARADHPEELVVLKAIPTPSLTEGTRLRLEHEQAAYSDLQSETLATLQEFLHDNGTWFGVRKSVPGRSLAERLQEGPLRVAEALALARSLLTAVQTLHDRGIFHRNIKPSNIIVNDHPEVAYATLVDSGFGDYAQVETTTDSADELETARYFSPEQAGSIDCPVGTSSDLYVVGLILFECLAGRPPFEGHTIGSLLLEHMTVQVSRIHNVHSEVPRALDDLIQRLLRKDPQDRYQTAYAALRDIEQISTALLAGDRDPSFVLGLHDRRRKLIPPGFVSRRRELDELCGHLPWARIGQGGLVLLEGLSGLGKSRLLTELAERGSEQAFLTLRAQGKNEVGQKPLQVLEEIVQGLLVASRNTPRLMEHIRERLGVHCEAVAAAIPELAPILKFADEVQHVPEVFGEARMIEGLSHFLDALGSADKPVLLILDDCQWADDFMIRLIARWHARRQADPEANRYVLVVASYRSDEIAEGHRLKQLTATTRLTVPPFNADEVRQLAESMAGPLPQEALDLVLRLSDGSPFMASAIMYGLVESGALLPTADGWRVEPSRLADLQSSHSATAFLLRRIELLQPQTIEALTIGAVLGKEFELDVGIALTEMTAFQMVGALEEARQRHLIWLNSESHAVFVHDRIRESFLDRLTTIRRRELHARAAEYLRERSPDRVFDLAYHFDAAERHDEALGYALNAAQQARSQYSLQVAEQQYRIAERGAEFSGDNLRFRVAKGLGEVKLLRGDYTGAEACLENAARLADGQLPRAEITLKLGELKFKRGEMEAATLSFEQAMRQLGRYVPRHFIMVLVLMVWEAVVQTAHTLLPRVFVGRRTRPQSDDELLSLRIFSRLAHGYWFIRGKVHVLWAHLRGMNLGERYQPTLELAQSYSEHAPAMSLVPWYQRGIDYARKSLEIRKELGDLWGQGQSLHYRGVVLFVASRFEECITSCREAVRILERTGDFWEVHTARYQIAAAQYRLGNLASAVEEARSTHKSGIDLGDTQASGIILDVWARATEGAVPTDVIETELKRHRHDAQGMAQVLLAAGACRMGAEDFAQSAADHERALAIARDAGVMNAYVSPNISWLASALRCQALADTSSIPIRRNQLLRRASAAARHALWIALRFKNDLPHALRENALIQSMRGRIGIARRLLDMSYRASERQGARYESVLTLNAQAKIAKEMNEPGSDEQFRRAKALLLEFRRDVDGDNDGASRVETFSLVDRFSVVLDNGRRIASALSADAVFNEAREAAQRLLRGEHCEIVPLPEGVSTPDELNATLVRSQFSATLITRAFQTQGVVTASGNETSDGMQTVGSDAISALCAPIFVRGAVKAFLCVTHNHIRGLFGKNEERLAGFITTITGAALENADGFFKLQQLNATLELRVAERTAAAENRAQELAISNTNLERTAAELRVAEEQLRIAKNAAEAASHAKSRFLATMSHEIRTPMNGVIGMTELALKTRLTSQQQNYLRVVKQSADALLRILNDILDFSKVEAGKLELEMMPFDLREVVGDATRILSIRAAQNNLELMFEVASDIPVAVIGDAGRLRQVLVNLIGNAIKFTPKGDVFVQVRLVEQTDDEVALHFAVRDTGIGIPPDKQQRIFESFSQADSSITRRFGGTGLGLSISAQLVGLMQGKLAVDSVPDEGSTFHFTARFGLPVHDDLDTPVPPSLPNVPVLVVDDHPNSRRIISDLMTELGLTPLSTGDARSALEILNQAAAGGTPFRLVVLDAVLAEESGRWLADQIRSTPALASCPIIYVSPASSFDGDTTAAEDPLAWHLTKPPKASELAEAVGLALGSLSAAAETPLDQPVQERSTRILLVDDGDVNREVAQGILEMQGYQVETATNGLEAVQILETKTFDAILMDLEMPEMDGMSATAEIRRREQLSNLPPTPIIAMTAHGISSIRQQCLEIGMTGYLNKPIQPDELFETLEACTSPVAAS